MLSNELFYLLVTFLVLLFLRVPISFAMGISSLIYFIYSGTNMGLFTQRLVGGLNSFPYLAIPIYILVGQIMNEIGVTDRIFDFARALIGHIRGGLAQVNVVASMIFAGIQGTAAADAASLGAMEMKVMKDEGYDPGFSAAVTAASSNLGPIIPPSVALIIYGVVADVSVGRLFFGGVIPGILIGFVMMVMIYIRADAKKLPVRKKATFKEVWCTFKKAFLPMLTPVIILSGILFGITTPTEAGVIAALYSIFLGFYYKTLTFKSLYKSARKALIYAGNVMFIFSTASVFSWIIVLQDIPVVIAKYLFTITANPLLIMLIMVSILIALGTIIDTSPLLLISAPVFAPIAVGLGYDEVHFGIILVLAIGIGLITPPMGVSLYMVSDVGDVPFEKIVHEIFPFIICLIIALVIIILFPPIVTWLPNLLFNK